MRKIAILIVAVLMMVASAAWGTVVFFPKAASSGGHVLVGPTADPGTGSSFNASNDRAFTPNRNTAPVAVASGTVAKSYAYFYNVSATKAKMLLYSSTGVLLGSSDELLAADMVDGKNEFTWTNGPSVVSGTAYYPAIIVDYGSIHMYYNGQSNWDLGSDTSGSYASPPDPASWGGVAYDNCNMYMTD